MRGGIRWSIRAFYFLFRFLMDIIPCLFFLVVWKAKVGCVDVWPFHLGLCGDPSAHVGGRILRWPMRNLLGAKSGFLFPDLHHRRSLGMLKCLLDDGRSPPLISRETIPAYHVHVIIGKGQQPKVYASTAHELSRKQ